MKRDLPRIHRLDSEESRLLLLYRLLPEQAKASMLKIIELQVEASSQQYDNVVSIGSRTIA